MRNNKSPHTPNGEGHRPRAPRMSAQESYTKFLRDMSTLLNDIIDKYEQQVRSHTAPPQ